MKKTVLSLLLIGLALIPLSDISEAKRKYVDPSGKLTTRRKAEARWDKENIRREKREMKYQERRNREIYHTGSDYNTVNNYTPYDGGGYYDNGYDYDYDRSPFNPDSDVQNRLRSTRERKNNSAANSSAYTAPRSGGVQPYNAAPGRYPNARSGMNNSQTPYGRAASRPAYRTNTSNKIAAARAEIERADIPDDKRDFVNRIQAGLNSSDKMEQHRALAEWNNYRQRLGVFNR
ncbi:hypothetical protein IJT93_08120 [bacterium]|nr:hypothetical protein [bacterium]